MTSPRSRLLLIEPPFYRLFKATYGLDRFPLGLGYLSGVVRERTDWDARVLNADFVGEPEPFSYAYLSRQGASDFDRALDDRAHPVWQEIADMVRRERPSVVGISAKTPSFASVGRVAALVKDLDPAVTVVVGGPHTTMVPDAGLSCAEIDIAVVGEGEETLPELLRALRDGDDPAAIPGLALRDTNGRVVHTGQRRLIGDLDGLPWPHLHAAEVLVDHDRYPIRFFRHVMATRGCPYHCTFCGSERLWTRRVRRRTISSVTDELAALQGLGVRFAAFEDDTFGVSQAFTRALCEAIRQDAAGLRWSCNTRVEMVDDESAAVWRRGGCHLVYLGIESGSDPVLNQIGKACTAEEAKVAADRLRAAGMQVVALFMLGLPGEDEADMRATLDAMRTITCDTLVLSVFTPYPGTAAWDDCMREGLVDLDYDPSRHHHLSTDRCFSAKVAPDAFAELVSEGERIADAHNTKARRGRLLTAETLVKVRELGLRGSARRAARVFLSRR